MASCSAVPKSLVEQPNDAPDYSQLTYWAAHPDKEDRADLVPEGLSSTPQAGKIYAPRYRQAHLTAYFEADSTTATKVFDLAYQDVKNAFQYYLDHHRQGRPFIIASHSQGTTHTTRLISELIDGKDLAKDMIAAYLVGMPVPQSMYHTLQPCQASNDTGCLISWRTYKKGFIPEKGRLGKDLILQNPISWTTDDSIAEKENHQGAILRNFDKILSQATDAQAMPGLGILWASKPKFPGSFLFTTNNYHIADIKNSKERVAAFHRLN